MPTARDSDGMSCEAKSMRRPRNAAEFQARDPGAVPTGTVISKSTDQVTPGFRLPEGQSTLIAVVEPSGLGGVVLQFGALQPAGE